MAVPYLFGILLYIYAWLGLLRGWTKELLVSFAAMLALAVNFMLRRYIPLVYSLPNESTDLFWVRVIILASLLYFGYVTVLVIPSLALRSELRTPRDRGWGLLLGILNGYLVMGTLLYYSAIANYPLGPYLPGPVDVTAVQFVNAWMAYMPPVMLSEPLIYFAVILTYVLVLSAYTNFWARLIVRKQPKS